MTGIRLALLVLVAQACASIPSEPANPVVIERPWGIATGETLAEAEYLAAVIEKTRPAYARLAGFRDVTLRAHMSSTALANHRTGVTIHPAKGDPWIIVKADASEIGHTVAHELAHAYFRDFSAIFPGVVEEGFCEELADSVVPSETVLEARLLTAAFSYLDSFTIVVDGPSAKRGLAYFTEEVPSIETALTLDSDDLFHSEVRAGNAFYGLGLMLVKRIGVGGLAELRDRAVTSGLERVPPEWILRAAGLEPLDQRTLHRAFAMAMGADERRAHRRITFTLSDG